MLLALHDFGNNNALVLFTKINHLFYGTKLGAYFCYELIN